MILHMRLACNDVRVIIFVQQMCEEFSPLCFTPFACDKLSRKNYEYRSPFFSRHHHRVKFFMSMRLTSHSLPIFFLLLLRFNIKNHLLKLISVSVLLGHCKAIEPTLHFIVAHLFFLWLFLSSCV